MPPSPVYVPSSPVHVPPSPVHVPPSPVCVPFRKKGDAAKEESKREKRQRDKSKKDKEKMPKESAGRAAEEGEEEWKQVQGRTKEPFRDLRKAFFPSGLDKVEPVELLKKRTEVVVTRGKKVRVCACVCVHACAHVHTYVYCIYTCLYIHANQHPHDYVMLALLNSILLVLQGTVPSELLEQLDFLLHVYREKKDFSKRTLQSAARCRLRTVSLLS